MEFFKKAFIGACALASARGLFLFLAAFDVYPEQWVATALGIVVQPDVRNGIVWALSGVVGLGIVLVWPRIETLRSGFWPGPISIIFDPENPSGRFWSLASWAPNMNGWEYRVEIKNNTSKTLENVVVIIEILSGAKNQYTTAVFKRTGEESCNIHPKSSELVKIFLGPMEPKQPGMLSGPSVEAYGDILIRASAKDTREITRRFKQDPYRVPIMFT